MIVNWRGSTIGNGRPLFARSSNIFILGLQPGQHRTKVNFFMS